MIPAMAPPDKPSEMGPTEGMTGLSVLELTYSENETKQNNE